MENPLQIDREYSLSFEFEVCADKDLCVTIFDPLSPVDTDYDYIKPEQAEKLRDFLNYHYPKEG